MNAQPVESPFKDAVTKELEKEVAIEFASYIEQNRDMTFDELRDTFYSCVIDKYNGNNEKVVGFSIDEISETAYKIDVWYW